MDSENNSSAQVIHGYQVSWVEEKNRTDMFGLPTEAWNGTSVRITYCDSKGNITCRLVTDVVFSKSKRGEQLMTGNDTAKDQCRSFKVANILKMEPA